jgi:hypothetical protein
MYPKQALTGIPVVDCGPVYDFTAALAIKQISIYQGVSFSRGSLLQGYRSRFLLPTFSA